MRRQYPMAEKSMSPEVLAAFNDAERTLGKQPRV